MRWIAIASLTFLPMAAPAQVRWGSNLEAAKSASARSHRPLLVDFMASWCGPCRMMEEQTFSDRRVKALLERLILVRLDIDRAQGQARQYDVNAIPRVLLLPPGGGEPLMDIQGFCEPDAFAQQLRSALGLKPEPAAGSSVSSPALARVQQALESGHYAVLKAADPKMASAGLDLLVEQLGAVRPEEYASAAAAIRRAGADSVPALIRGLSHRMLSVRAGAYRGLRDLLGSHGGTALPEYDPWAPAASRTAQAQRWALWWSRRVSQTR